MQNGAGRWLRTAGIVLIIVAAVSAVILFIQPWRSCDYEDTSAGCAVLPRDATLMIIALLIGAVGIVMTLAGVALRRRT